MSDPLGDPELLPAGYAETLEAIKAEVRSTQIRVARVTNSQMIELYWRLGRLILDRRMDEGYGTRVVARLSANLKAEFPGARGFSAGNLNYMRRFATAWPGEVCLQVVGKLGWGQIQTLLDRVDTRDDRAITTTDDTITVRLDRRAYNPVLRTADLPETTTVPWWDNRTLRYQIS